MGENFFPEGTLNIGMRNKVLMVLVDGMRPDALPLCGHPLFSRLTEESAYTLSARTVFPSVTLPCHMSLFHSVEPERHGILTNLYVPQVRPVKGLFDVLHLYKKRCAMFYNWEELRDLSRPGALSYSYFASLHTLGLAKANDLVADACAQVIASDAPDCVFLYLGYTDEQAHLTGWMGEEYLASIRQSFDCIERVLRVLPEDYSFLLTADHGGHDRCHGTDMPEDMTIPVFLRGKAFAPGVIPGPVSILDLAPTVAALLGVPADDDWEGKPLC